jgi:hypothetical protein
MVSRCSDMCVVLLKMCLFMRYFSGKEKKNKKKKKKRPDEAAEAAQVDSDRAAEHFRLKEAEAQKRVV